MNKRKTYWKSLGILFLFGIFFAIWVYRSQRPVPATYLTLQEETYKETFLVSGKVQLDNALSLESEANGRVKKVFVQAGTSVKAGDLLVLLENKDVQLNLKAAQSDYNKALVDLRKVSSVTTNSQSKALEKLQIQIDQLTNDLNKAEQLFKEGALSASDLDAAKQALALTLAERDTELSKLNDSKTSNSTSIVSAQAVVSSKEVQVQLARLQVNRLEIRAPFDGVIIQSDLKSGETVNNGDSVVFMAKSMNKYCEINPDEKYLPLIKVGQPTLLYADHSKDKPIEGKVVWMSPQVDRNTGTIKVKISLSEDRPWLIQNLLLRCEILIGTYPNSLVLPINYLISDNSSSSVFIAQSGKVEKQPVTVSHVDNGKIRILSGLKPGDKILKPDGLKAGMNVNLIQNEAGGQ